MVLPGLLHISLVQAMVQEKVMIGGQNLSATEPGAFTGEIAADHFQDYGIEYVLVGHSERRTKFNETPEIVSKKVQQAVECELGVIYCIGDNKD